MITRFLIGSICANLVLTGLAIHLRTPNPVRASVFRPPLPSHPQRVTPQTETIRATPLQVNTREPFSWGALESTNFEVYVANLRAVGCPEPTVRDIVLGELEDLYNQQKLSEMRSSPFWSCGSERKTREQRERSRCLALEQEYRESVDRLLGSGLQPPLWEVGRVIDFQEYGIMRALAGPLPREVLLSVYALGKGFDDAESALHDGTGVVLPEDSERARQKLHEQCDRLKLTMSPEQFMELSARCVGVDFAFHSDNKGFTSQELREVSRIRANIFGLEGTFSKCAPLPDVPEREKQFEQSLRTYLGEARYGDYVRSKDSVYMQLQEFAAEQGLAGTVATTLSDIQKVLEEESSKVREDATLSSRERKIRLFQMQAEVQMQAAALMGETSYSQYIGKGGNWLTNTIVLP